MDVAAFTTRGGEEAPPRWVLPIRHLSASSLTMAQRCPEQWRQRYVIGRKERPGQALVLGSAFHETQGFNFAQKIETHEDLPGDTVEEFFNDVAWPQAIDKSGGLEEIAWDGKPEAQQGLGSRMARAYHEQVSPRIQPLAVELEFHVDVGLPVPVLGYVDVEREHALTEMKTSGKRMSTPKPEWRLQGRLYQAVRSKPVEWHVVTKTKETAVVTPVEAPDLLLEVDEREQGRMAELARSIAWSLNHFMTAIGPDDPWPGAITHPWACGFCGFKGGCHWW